MCTNHKDGVPTTADQRRYTILYTAQQCKSDKMRDGMGGSYFPDLYDWFTGRGKYAEHGANYGYAVVCDYLHKYALCAELNPARDCQEAPRSSSSDEAVSLSLGNIEQEVAAAITNGQPGFIGGWVSSLALDKLLKDNNMNNRMPHVKRKEMMRGLGYERHPGLANGQVNNNIKDACGLIGKPVLYIKIGHIVGNIVGNVEIVKHYLDCQIGAAAPGAACPAFATAGG
jgi:hypothetical protein